MPRARNLKHSFFTNDELAECKYSSRLLFAGLWTIADREGRLADRPKKIKAELFPFDAIDVDDGLNELASHGLIQRYQVGDLSLIWIVNFAKHQSPHRNEVPSILPAPEQPQSARVRRTTKVGTRPRGRPPKADALTLTEERGLLTADRGMLNEDGGEPGSQAAPAAADPGFVFRLYEQTIGTLDPHIKTRLEELANDYGAECLGHCFAEASEMNKRSLRYAEAILKRHKAEGCYATRRNGRSEPEWTTEEMQEWANQIVAEQGSA